MGVDLRANRQMTTMRCRNEDQEISEEDAAMVQVRLAVPGNIMMRRAEFRQVDHLDVG